MTANDYANIQKILKDAREELEEMSESSADICSAADEVARKLEEAMTILAKVTTNDSKPTT